jgi:hypothetical protein
MKQPGLDDRHQILLGRISRKRGDTVPAQSDGNKTQCASGRFDHAKNRKFVDNLESFAPDLMANRLWADVGRALDDGRIPVFPEPGFPIIRATGARCIM